MTSHDLRITRDIPYATGHVGDGTPDGPHARNLLLDVYEPAARTASGPRPALVLAFGGAFHRGSKENDVFPDTPGTNTATSEYCRIFAERGYVTASVDYRLTQERPPPSARPWMTDRNNVSRSRMDVVRDKLGLPPADTLELINGVEAAYNDVADAFTWLRSNAADFNIDPDRMALGGYSAGATAALYARFAGDVQARAIACLSGRMEAGDIANYLSKPTDTPILQIIAEDDLEYVVTLGKVMAGHCTSTGQPLEQWHIPGANHFYLKTAQATGPHGDQKAVADVVADFLEGALT